MMAMHRNKTSKKKVVRRIKIGLRFKKINSQHFAKRVNRVRGLKIKGDPCSAVIHVFLAHLMVNKVYHGSGGTAIKDIYSKKTLLLDERIAYIKI